MFDMLTKLNSFLVSIDPTRKKLQNSLILLFCIYGFLFLLLGANQQICNLKLTAIIRFFRGALFLFFATFLVQVLFSDSKLKYLLIFTALPSILTIALYSFVLIKTGQLSYLGRYYMFAPLLFFGIFICLAGLSYCNWLRLPIAILYGTFYFLYIFSAVLYTCYFLVYGDSLDVYGFISILNTTFSETKAYLLHIFTPILLIGILLLVILIFFASIICTLKLTTQKITFASQITIPKWLLYVLTILFFTLLGHHMGKVFPIDIPAQLHRNTQHGLLHVFSTLKQNIGKNANKIIIKKDILANSASQRTPGSIIIVIGESANRDRMDVFNPTFGISTTPWENSCKNCADFTFFPHSYSNFPNTVISVTQAMIDANQYNHKELKNTVSIVDVAKKIGYTTYWISMQEKGSIHDAGITTIAEQADKSIWSSGGYDEAILDELKSLPLTLNTNNFIILHLMGSHTLYSERIPNSFQPTLKFPSADPHRDYDLSLLYTDYVLQQIFQYAQKHLNLQSMIYFSDHGEDMKYMHTTSPFHFSMVRIPFWIYLSPSYQKAYPEVLPVLKSHSQSVFTNDLIFDTVSGLLHANTNFYSPEYDISNPGYCITRENAKTLHGKRLISEDMN